MLLEEKLSEIKQNLLTIEKEIKKMNEETFEKQKYLYAFSLRGTLKSANFFMKQDNLREEYDKYVRKIRKVIQKEYGEVELLDTPLKVKIIYFFDKYEYMVKDVDNYYKILIDALKKSLILDDKFIEELVILKKKTDKPYTYVSFYIENYNNEEINYIPEKIGEIPDVTIEKKEVDLKENNLKTEIIGGNAVNLEDVKNYFKKFKPNYDESCAKLEISNENYPELINTFLKELKKIKDDKKRFEENFLEFIGDVPKFVDSNFFLLKYSSHVKKSTIRNFNRRRVNRILRKGFGYEFDKDFQFKKI